MQPCIGAKVCRCESTWTKTHSWDFQCLRTCPQPFSIIRTRYWHVHRHFRIFGMIFFCWVNLFWDFWYIDEPTWQFRLRKVPLCREVPSINHSANLLHKALELPRTETKRVNCWLYSRPPKRNQINQWWSDNHRVSTHFCWDYNLGKTWEPPKKTHGQTSANIGNCSSGTGSAGSARLKPQTQ